MSENPQIQRINALTQNARTTWFALLSVLLFVGVTLMGVQHIDFYGVDRATQLPLINVSVPTPLFFYAAPLLTASVYGYFHLYLIRLWDALGEAEARIDGKRLGEITSPWLVTDAALHLRAWFRTDNCTAPRALEGASMLLNILLAWVFGLFVLGWLWWASMPAREWEMTGIAGLSFLAGLLAGVTSLSVLVIRMRKPQDQHFVNIFTSLPAFGRTLALAPLILAIGHFRSHGEAYQLAPLDLSGQDLVQHPADWLPEQIAKKDFLAIWCKREAGQCEPKKDPPDAFEEEWNIRWTARLAGLKKPHWNGAENGEPDLRNAVMTNAFLPGADLSGAQMDGAILGFAQMDGADLSGAQMDGAILGFAQMDGANLSFAKMDGANLSFAKMDRAILSGAKMDGAILSDAKMDGANLSGAKMDGANLSGAKMDGANLSFAKMDGAILSRAQMDGAILSRAKMDGAILSDAKMDGAILRGAKMDGANLRDAKMDGAILSFAKMDGAILSFAKMDGANLSGALLTGTSENRTVLKSTNLSATVNDGGALRFVDFTDAVIDDKTEWRNAFFDSSVVVPIQMRDQIGNPCLWDWIETQNAPLSDEAFFGHWRGWLRSLRGNDSIWTFFAPSEWRNVSALDPPAGCHRTTDPLQPTSGD